RCYRGNEIALLDFFDANFSRLVAAFHRAGDADDHDRQCDCADNCPLGAFLHVSIRLAKGMTNGALESGEGLVVVVIRGDAVTLRALVSCARLRQVDEGGRSDSVTVLNQLELLLGLGGIRLLKSDRL